MRDKLLQQILRLETWLEGSGRAWKFLPLRILGYLLLIFFMLVSNLFAIAAMPLLLIHGKNKP